MSYLQDLSTAKQLIGQPLDALPLPCFILDRAKLRRNCQRMLAKLEPLSNLHLRVEVEHLKCGPVTMEALGNGRYDRVVASTLQEVRQLICLVEGRGRVKDVLYGVPVGKSCIKELAYLRNFYYNLGATLRVMVDHPSQIELLAQYPGTLRRWSVFIQMDSKSTQDQLAVFDEIVQAIALHPDKFELFGIYSYIRAAQDASSPEVASAYLQGSIDLLATCATRARAILKDPSASFCLSFGSTVTARVLTEEVISRTDSKDSLEFHAGCFASHDMRHVQSGLFSTEDIACTVLCEVQSSYPSRNEFLVNAGHLAVGRDFSIPVPGAYVLVHGQTDWMVRTEAPERGIVTCLNKDDKNAPWKIGDLIRIYPENTCLCAASHKFYFIIDEDIVVDVWQPWKYW